MFFRWNNRSCFRVHRPIGKSGCIPMVTVTPFLLHERDYLPFMLLSISLPPSVDSMNITRSTDTSIIQAFNIKSIDRNANQEFQVNRFVDRYIRRGSSITFSNKTAVEGPCVFVCGSIPCPFVSAYNEICHPDVTLRPNIFLSSVTTL